MNIWLKSAALGLAAAVIGFFLLRLRDKKVLPPLYDMSFTLQTEGASDAGTTRSVATNLEERLEGLDFTMKITGPGAINVRIHRVPDTTYIRQLVSSTGQVAFRLTYSMADLGNDYLGSLFKAARKNTPEKYEYKPLSPSDSLQLKMDSTENTRSGGENEKNSKDMLLKPGYGSAESAEIGYTLKEDTSALSALLRSDSLQDQLKHGLFPEFCFGLSTYPDPNLPGKLVLYALAPKNPLNGNYLENEDIKSAKAEFTVTGRPVISIMLTKPGQRKFSRISGENQGKTMALVLDQLIISAPRIESEVNTPFIQITGEYRLNQCQILARLISSRPMTTPVTVLSATTGRASIPFEARQLIGPALLFLLAGGLAFFVFKTLKST